MYDPGGEALPVARARALIGAALPRPDSEVVATAEAVGRILAAPILAEAAVPQGDRAARNGYALRAADTVGAGDYTPLALALCQRSDVAELPGGSAVAVTSGDSLPGGADAVLALDLATAVADRVEVLAPVPPGCGVELRASELDRASPVVPPDRRLREQDVALLAALGIAAVPVLRRLRVGVITAGAKMGAADALMPLLLALLARDGAGVPFCCPAGRDRAALRDAIARGAGLADLLIVAGGGGDGPDDHAVWAIADAGGAAVFRGVTLDPGGGTGLWRAGEVAVLLLPGAPLACMVAYDVLASMALRRVDAAYATTDALLERKISSRIGCMDAVRVTLNAGRAAPLGEAKAGGLASLSRADGYVLVPEASEGFAPESRVRVHLYGLARQEAA